MKRRAFLSLLGQFWSARLAGRQYDVPLAAEPGGYRLPERTARKVVVHLNGLRQRPSVDYGIKGGLVVPLWAWPSAGETSVTCDFDP